MAPTLRMMDFQTWSLATLISILRYLKITTYHKLLREDIGRREESQWVTTAFTASLKACTFFGGDKNKEAREIDSAFKTSGLKLKPWCPEKNHARCC
jgi:hypothetical protein